MKSIKDSPGLQEGSADWETECCGEVSRVRTEKRRLGSSLDRDSGVQVNGLPVTEPSHVASGSGQVKVCFILMHAKGPCGLAVD